MGAPRSHTRANFAGVVVAGLISGCITPIAGLWAGRIPGGIEIGDGRLDVKVERLGSKTELAYAKHPSLEIVIGAPAAPLWGAPFANG